MTLPLPERVTIVTHYLAIPLLINSPPFTQPLRSSFVTLNKWIWFVFFFAQILVLSEKSYKRPMSAPTQNRYLFYALE